MCPLEFDPDRSDVLDTGYRSAVVTVGTTQVEAKSGASALTARQAILLHNDGNDTVYVGPSGVSGAGAAKGVALYKKQSMFISVGYVPMYLIATTPGNSVIVQEFS
jgi:hypothetical protein